MEPELEGEGAKEICEHSLQFWMLSVEMGPTLSLFILNLLVKKWTLSQGLISLFIHQKKADCVSSCGTLFQDVDESTDRLERSLQSPNIMAPIY